MQRCEHLQLSRAEVRELGRGGERWCLRHLPSQPEQLLVTPGQGAEHLTGDQHEGAALPGLVEIGRASCRERVKCPVMTIFVLSKTILRITRKGNVTPYKAC